MVLNFVIDDNGFRIIKPTKPEVETSVNYIKCHFEIDTDQWDDVDAIVAVFKSARYNIMSEVILDSNNNCFIDPKVYKRGGTIQVKLFGDKYNEEEVLSTSHVTGTLEFVIEESELTPTEPPSKYSVFIAELERAGKAVDDSLDDLAEKLANHEFDGPQGVGIVDVSYLPSGQNVITLSDGSVFTSEYSLKGDTGPQGIQGVQGERGLTGIGISSVRKTSTSGLVDTYTITFTDGTTSTYSITNGRDAHGGGTFEIVVNWESEDPFSGGANYDLTSSFADVLQAIQNDDRIYISVEGDECYFTEIGYHVYGNSYEIITGIATSAKPYGNIVLIEEYRISMHRGEQSDAVLTKYQTTVPTSDSIPTYTAGTGISISNGVISLDLSQAEGGNY